VNVLLRIIAIVILVVGSLATALGGLGALVSLQHAPSTCDFYQPDEGALGVSDPVLDVEIAPWPLGAMCVWRGESEAVERISPVGWGLTIVTYGGLALVGGAIAGFVVLATRRREQANLR
jgi:hypothetical protein